MDEQPHPAPRHWWLHVVLAVALGAALRLHDLAGQVPLSDEWHGLHAAALHSYRELATLLTAGATSIPSNLYYRWLLEGVGWSEWSVRLPSLVAGVATVAVAPLLLRRSIGEDAAALSGYLLAVSPLLVFYSRYARPYAPVVVLTLVAFLACRRWAATGSWRPAVVFVVAAVLAGWLHLLEVRALGLAWGFVVAAKLLGRRVPALAVVPSWRALALVGLAGALALAGLLLPAVLSSGERFFSILEADRPTPTTVLDALALLGGTGRRPALLVLLPLSLLGWGRLYRRDAGLAALFAVVSLGCLASVLVAHPVDSEVALVFARYSIPLLPIGLVTLALGVELVLDVLARLLPQARESSARATRAVAVGGVAAAALYAGPLPELYAGPNAFTVHKAYHASYAPARDEAQRYARYLREMRWEGGPVNVAVSPFYRRLARDPAPGAVIEYPLPVGDLYCFQFLLQRVHGRRVLAGWLPRPPSARAQIAPGFLSAGALIDDALGPVRDLGALRFASLVRIDDARAVRASGARWLVLHRDLGAELRSERADDLRRPALAARLEAEHGAPVWEDAWLLVYAVADD